MTTVINRLRQSVLLTLVRMLSIKNEISLEELFGAIGIIFSTYSLFDYVNATRRIIEDGMRSGMERSSISNLVTHTYDWHATGPPFVLTSYLISAVILPVSVSLCISILTYYLSWRRLSKAKVLRKMPKLSQVFAFLIILCVCLNLTSNIQDRCFVTVQKSRETYIDQNDPGLRENVGVGASVFIFIERANVSRLDETGTQEQTNNFDKVPEK